MTDRIELPSVRDRDLRNLLEHYGLADLVDRGLAFCASCGAAISWDNIGAILVDHKQLVLFCDFSECIDSAARGQSAWKTS